MSLLEMRGVYGGYGEVDILNGVDLCVDPGQIVAVVGPNGAGKSTALKAIFGLVRVRRGSVLFEGAAITGMQPHEIVRRGLCYVPQESNVFTSLTVQENLEMGAFIRSDDFSAQLAHIYDIFPPLKERRSQAAGSLSGGQRQMVAIGRALMLEPKLLLLDEPTAGLAPQFVELILAKVREINARGVSVLMVEQNAKQALKLAHRGYILTMGLNRFDDTGPNLLANREVAEMFLGG